jgi:hypothetical protein
VRKPVHIEMPPPRAIAPSEFSPVSIALSGKAFIDRIADYDKLHQKVSKLSYHDCCIIV